MAKHFRSKPLFLKISLLLFLLVAMVGNAWGELYSVDFESTTSTYSDWTFTNMSSRDKHSNVTAHGGTYIGTTNGKETASMVTKNPIAQPLSITFYVSKATSNTTASNWYIQVSDDNITWKDVKVQSAISMNQGSWVEVTQDLSSYSNVYVRVYYSGSSALRTIDDLSLAFLTKPLSSIEILGAPTRTTYDIGSTFDPAGLSVIGTNTDNTTVDLTPIVTWTIDPFTITSSTTKVIAKASIGDISDTKEFDISVSDTHIVTYKFSSFDSADNVTLTDLDGFTITLTKGTYRPSWNTTYSEARVYAKGSLIINASNAQINSIEYSYKINSGGNGNDVPTIEYVKGTTSAGIWDVNSKTWTGNDNEVTLSTSGLVGNIGFTQLVIKYKENQTITRSIATNKYGTICVPASFRVSGATLYSAELNDDKNAVILTEENNPVAGIPYIYLATADEQEFTYSSYNVVSSPTETPPLVGVFVDTKAPVGSYVLQIQGDEQKFYKVTDADHQPTVGAFKAYLEVPSSAKVISLGFSDEETAAVSSLEAIVNGEAKIYDPAGRRIPGVRKGLNIVNGVKILVK